jgi:hypothetical protein
MNKIQLFTLCVLFSSAGFLAAAQEEYSVPGSTLSVREAVPAAYKEAKSSFDSKDYKTARKQLKRLIKDMTGTQWEYRARLLMSRSWKIAGNIKKAVSELDTIFDAGFVKTGIPEVDIIDEFGGIHDALAAKRLKEILVTSQDTVLRSRAVFVLAGLVKKMGPEYMKENIDFLIKALDAEAEMGVAREIVRSIYSLGRLRADQLMDIYENADGLFRKKLLLLISMYDDEDMIMTLQQDIERSGNALMNYVKWALARMDPYRFAGSFSGRLRKEEGAYLLYSGSSVRELLGPSLKRKHLEDLEHLIGKVINIYGVEVEEGIIFTDIYRSR